MALPPNKLPGYVNIKNLEKYIDDCLKTGKYTYEMGSFYIEMPFNLVQDEVFDSIDALRNKYLAAGWLVFDIAFSWQTGDAYAFRLRM